MSINYLKLQIIAGGLVGVWPPPVAAILAGELVQHVLVGLALLADPAAGVALRETINQGTMRMKKSILAQTRKRVYMHLEILFIKFAIHNFKGTMHSN